MNQIYSCSSCERVTGRGETHCDCGRPTSFASFEDRAAYEVAQWRAHRERAEAMSAVRA